MSKFPTERDYILFYEVADAEGNSVWGGESAYEAIKWYSQSILHSRIYVSAWESEDMEAHMLGRAIDITGIINQAIVKGKGE